MSETYEELMRHMGKVGVESAIRGEVEYGDSMCNLISAYHHDMKACLTSYRNIMSGYNGEMPTLSDYLISSYGSEILNADYDFKKESPAAKLLKSMMQDHSSAVLFNFIKDIGGIDTLKKLKGDHFDEIMHCWVDSIEFYDSSDELIMDFCNFSHYETLCYFEDI